MARDPQMPLSDVQWVLGHARLSTTQMYLTPAPAEVIAEVLAHYRRRQAGAEAPGAVPAIGAGIGSGYRAESLATLFSKRPS
jgi:hypothetical protein